VEAQLGDKVDIILDGGPCRVGVESTVLDMTFCPPRILRPGGMSRERIEALIGQVDIGAGTTGPPVSPGQLKSHYAPRTPLSVHSRSEILSLAYESAEAYLFFDNSSRSAWLAGQAGLSRRDSPRLRVLSESGDLIEAAAALFDTLHSMDTLGASRIRAELAPDGGLGPAINDRLFRAATVV
jgi:L-threonylcarbamoyladenylate synthase